MRKKKKTAEHIALSTAYQTDVIIIFYVQTLWPGVTRPISIKIYY